VVGALAAPPVFAGDDADAVTAGAATARVAANAATTTVRRVDRITILLVGVAVGLTIEGGAVRSRFSAGRILH
jgi:hypothetical protein